MKLRFRLTPMKATLALTCSLAVHSSAQNLIVNGSFEMPVIADASYTNPPANALAPWETDGDTFELWSNGMAVNSSEPTVSAAGRQNLEVLGGGTAVWQSVATTPNENYVLSFFHSPRVTVHSTLSLSIGSRVLATFDEDGAALTGFNWQTYVTNFTATSTSTVIRFSDSAPTSAGTHIDGVTLTVAPRVEHAIFKFTQREVTTGSGANVPVTTSGIAVFEPDTLRAVVVGGFKLNNQLLFVIKPLRNHVITHVTAPNGVSHTIMAKAESPGTQYVGTILESSYLRGRDTIVTLGGPESRLMPKVLTFLGRGIVQNADTEVMFATEAKGTYTLDLPASQISNLAVETFAATVARYSNSFVARGYLEIRPTSLE